MPTKKKVQPLDKRLISFAKTSTGKGTWTLAELSRKFDATVPDLEETIAKLRKSGFDFNVESGVVEYLRNAPPGTLTSHFWRLKEGGWLRFGVLGDTHLGSSKQRLDILNTAYDHFESEGIDTVYHHGNMLDGYHPRINAFELQTGAGTSIESQVAYAQKLYPQKEGMKTFFITGDCHEGWWAKSSGVNVGRVMENRFMLPESCQQLIWKNSRMQRACSADIRDGYCKKHGRKDLIYLGHAEADLELRTPNLKRGARGPIIRLLHPGGGSAYALSYTTQKIAEHLQGGEKPQIQLVGHYHKYDINYHREIYNVQCGCLQDQTLFMRKNKLAAHVGYIICEVFIGRDGTIERVRHEWKPFYDRGFYAQRQK
jgi:predicted phosphodiesterase